MGIYWWSGVYYGSLISSRAIVKLKTHPLITANQGLLKKVTSEVNREQWIFHAPGMLAQVGWTDRLIDNQKGLGVIQWDRRFQKLIDEWPKDELGEDMKQFRTLADAISNDHENTLGFYVIKAVWTTYDGPYEQTEIQANLPVVNAPPLEG
jgi:hypothetical protein